MEEKEKPRFAVILCGSGYLDGSEIRESVAVLTALSSHDVEVQCFAPDAPVAHVMDHLKGHAVLGETRHQLTEAARIARGQILSLHELKPSQFSGVLIPGGYGVAQNLCNFAEAGAQATVRPEVQTLLESFHRQKKPIGAICIAPALVALCFRGMGMELTLGPPSDASREVEKLGHHPVRTEVDECHVDAKHRIVSTGAYMFDDPPLYQVFYGIQKVVDEMMELL